MASPQEMTGNRSSSPPIRWRKSSYSGDTGNCVEVAILPSNKIGIRDSKNPNGPVLIFDKPVWDYFLTGTRRPF